MAINEWFHHFKQCAVCLNLFYKNKNVEFMKLGSQHYQDKYMITWAIELLLKDSEFSVNKVGFYNATMIVYVSL